MAKATIKPATKKPSPTMKSKISLLAAEKAAERRNKQKGVATLGPISDAISKLAAAKRTASADQPRSKSKAFDGFTVEFVLDRETKGAAKYQEVDGRGRRVEMRDEGCHIGPLYVRKSAFNGNVPKRITVSVR